MVEVDASEVGVGAVLSQRSSSDQKLYPCAFFSRCLPPAERNYDIGNWELLAVKLALEEWRHWLKGASRPFLAWTDHKNLQYIRSARCLNSRQACWSLFFTCFNFTLSYRPGSRNQKSDTLSGQFPESKMGTLQDPDSILPSSYLIGADSWPIEDRVKAALQRHSGLSSCPDGLFVPTHLCSEVLQWAHSSHLTCHSGVHRTLNFLQ